MTHRRREFQVSLFHTFQSNHIPRNYLPRRVLAVGGLLLGLAGLAAVGIRFAAPQPPLSPVPATQMPSASATAEPTDLSTIRAEAWRRIGPRLDAADDAAAFDVTHGIDELRLFFEERKFGTRAFAESVLSLRGKWALAKSKLPFADDSGHSRFLNEQFARHVFRADELQAALERAIGTYVADLQAVENQLLVDVRADLADLPLAAFPALGADRALEDAYRRMAEDVAALAASDAGIDLPRWVGSWVAGDVAAKIALRIARTVAARLGVTAGVWGAGAAGSWASFGLSVGAAIIVDIAADWVIGWFYDPVADVSARVNQTLDRVRDLIIEGEQGSPGLRRELERLGAAQSEVRRTALRRLVLGDNT
jgi:hypothetical protein